MTETRRYYDLDALRALAMFLGITLHAAIFVLPSPEFRWPIHDAAASGDLTYKLVINAIHGFRMPIFFLMSGFFSALLWQRRGMSAFLEQRLKRVGVPLLVGCFTLIPATVWLLKLIADQRNMYTEIYDQLTVLVTPFIFIGQMGHLWFLWYLLIITFMFTVLTRMRLRFNNSRWWSLIPVSAVSMLFMREPLTFGADTVNSLVPELAVLLYYSCFFFFGVFFYVRKMTVHRWWVTGLLPSALLFMAGMWLIDLYRVAHLEQISAAGEAGALYVEYIIAHPHSLRGAVIQVSFAWLMCFALMGGFRWLFASVSRTTQRVVQYLSDSTYWMYLVHLPLVILWQWTMLDLPISYHLKYLLVVAGVTAMVLVTYAWGVRHTFIGHTLNGPRPRQARQSGPA